MNKTNLAIHFVVFFMFMVIKKIVSIGFLNYEFTVHKNYYVMHLDRKTYSDAFFIEHISLRI